MSELIGIKEVDRTFYAERLCDWLPEKIIDILTHIWRDCDTTIQTKTRDNVVSWPYGRILHGNRAGFGLAS